MGRCRKVFHGFRCQSMNYLNIRCSKFSLIFLDQITGFLITLNRIDTSVHSRQCQFDGHRSGSCSYVVDNGILWKLKLCHRKASDLTLGHWGFPSGKFFIIHTGTDTAERCLIFDQCHTKSVNGLLQQFFRRS